MNEDATRREGGWWGRALDRSIVLSFDATGYRRHAREFDPADLEVDLAGRVMLVTGANAGIGRATARRLAELGAEVYLLDEPFAGVDAATEKAIIDVLKFLQSSGKTVVAVHHDLSTVPEYFSHVFMVNKTRMAEGSVANAFTAENLQTTYGGRLATAQIDQLALGG